MKNILNKFKINEFTYILFLFALLSGYFKELLIVFVIVVFHELGHVVFFSFFKIKINKVVIYPFGGITYIDSKIHERIYKMIICSFGGIIFQIILYFVFNYLFNIGAISFYTFNLFLHFNYYIFIFNLLPIIPLDGSKILLYSLCSFISFYNSYRLYMLFSFIFILLFIYLNFIFEFNNFFIIGLLFVYLFKTVKNFKYVLNLFFIERFMYDHYYDDICYVDDYKYLKLNKFYYINYLSEKTYFRNMFKYWF